MITATDLGKRFGEKSAVEGLTFEVNDGEVLGFLGPNGAGKTTTMRMLTCFFPPSSGQATVAGYDIQSASTQVKRNIGYLPETVPLYPEMTTREVVEFSAHAKGMHHSERKAAVDEAISRCNLGSVQDQLTGTISRGFRQRTALAQAIVNRPRVLILDEPTVGLDPQQILDIRSLIKELAHNSTVLLSTHILPEVEAICNRVIILSGGKIRAMDTPANLTKALQGSTLIQMQIQGSGPDTVAQALREVKGVRLVQSDADNRFRVEADPALDPRPDLSRLVVHKGWELLELSTRTMKLEDIFLKIVREEGSHASPGLSPPGPAQAEVPAAEPPSDGPEPEGDNQ